MKNESVTIRASKEDRELIKRAASKLRPGQKADISKTIIASVKLASTITPELYYCNRQGIVDLNNNISTGQKLLQGLIDELMKAVPDIEVTIENIQNWFGTARNNFMVADTNKIQGFVISFLFDKQQKKYPDLNFSKDNILLPDLESVNEAAGKLINLPLVQFREVGIYWSAYTLVDGTVNLIPGNIELIKNLFRVYAEAPAERQRLAKVRELCENLNSFVKGETFSPEKLNIRDVLHYDHDSGRFEPSELYVKFSF